jgi:hypothetical protein
MDILFEIELALFFVCLSLMVAVGAYAIYDYLKHK